MGISARLRDIAGNLDIIVVFVVAMVVGGLDLLNVIEDGKADGVILPVLAALAFVWIRDRHRQRRVADQLAKVATTTDGMWSLLTSGQSVITLTGPAISRELTAARAETDRWLFKGSTGTFTRAVTLPECVEHAQRQRRKLTFRLEILDPADLDLCAAYTRLHRDLAPAGTEEKTWTDLGTRQELYATILAACWYRQRNRQLLDIEVRVSQTLSLFRWDLSWSRLIITQRGPAFPAVSIPRGSPHYNLWATELENSLSQARRLPLERATPLGDTPTVEEAHQLFAALGVAVDLAPADLLEVTRIALDHLDPYRDHVATVNP
ncbi:hypothetical protein ACWENQ_20450 [Nonomuraea sp. NPDC004354]|uniref:hypothetical protein n=1 Tax=Nonomuraea sp. NPDC003804 TaxID=3154547 RepID=UPI0033B899E0